ncbi:hypothetical protein [Nocardia rosealba]|uniref:hypothetical protein n=1 Tax=Nocardia rosealba TaxID=2878563 RepID=UPI001CD93609|nr:hypothetical protein [Nocardia rosealba]MCA2210142.1 hypothetical protein [Nocardia rosealba]
MAQPVPTLEQAQQLLRTAFESTREFNLIETRQGWVAHPVPTAEQAEQGMTVGQGNFVINKATGVITAHSSLPMQMIGEQFDQAIETGRPVQGHQVYPPLHRIHLVKTFEDPQTVRYQVHVMELEQPNNPPTTQLLTIDKETLHFQPSSGPLSQATAWAEMLSRTTGSWPTEETIDR